MFNMRYFRLMTTALFLILLQLVSTAHAADQQTPFAANDRYNLSMRASDGAVVVELKDGTRRAFTPDFNVLYSDVNPKLTKKPVGYAKVRGLCKGE